MSPLTRLKISAILPFLLSILAFTRSRRKSASLLQKTGRTELSCFAKWGCDYSAGLQHHADQEGGGNRDGNFIPVITLLPYFPHGEKHSEVAINEKMYIKVRIATLSHSTALISHCR